MKTHELEEIKEIIEGEGFNYTFIHYASFNEIKDQRFQKLKNDYIKAEEKLKKYLGVKDYE